MNSELSLVIKRLEKHPHMVSRIIAILDVAENTYGNIELANDAEKMVLEEIEKMGQEMLTMWGKGQELKKRKMYEEKAGAIKYGKKKQIG